MPAKTHGLTQGIEENFAVWTGAKVGPDFTANVCGKLIVHIGREMT